MTELHKDEGSFRDLVRSRKVIANKYDREFDLTNEQLRILFKGNCHYCGIKPKQIWRSRACRRNPKIEPFVYNGIDRLDNSKGYTIDNCVSCCRRCNSAKNKFSVSEIFPENRQWWNQQIGKIG